jgi:hypothetical protein
MVGRGVSISILIHVTLFSHMKYAQRGFAQPNFITPPNLQVGRGIVVLPDYVWVLVYYLTTLSLSM